MAGATRVIGPAGRRRGGYMGAASRLALTLACFGLGAMPASAIDGMWLAAPATNDFNTGSNWTSNPSVPNGTASFGASTQTSLTFSSLATNVGTLQFNAAAPAYTFTLVEQCTPGCVTQTLTLNGTGIVNNAAIAPSLKTTFFAGLTFTNSSTAANANIVVQEGFLDFRNTSNAGSATITMPDSLHAGFITFHDSSSAGSATITTVETNGAQGTSELIFLDKSTAGNATINNNPGTVLDPSQKNGGNTDFGTFGGTDTADAGHAHITNNKDGATNFYASTSAANAVIVNTTATSQLSFRDQSTAANATITNNLGSIFVAEQATLGNAVVTNNNGFIEFGFSGLFPLFIDTASAGNSTITNNGGTITFNSATTAGNATITNNAGFMFFFEASTAGSANIANAGSISFLDSSSAGNATITTAAGSFLLSFADQSTASNATITTNAGSLVQFTDQASGGNARFITNAGGKFDISGVTTAGTTAGSIEGAGNYFLGSKQLTVGSNNLSTTVDGVISDGGMSGGTGASLVKVGTGTLTLNGANTYTGPTTVNGGILGVNGSLLSVVTVNSGAELMGNGSIKGLNVNGGTVAPGNSIGTLTVNGPVTFNSGSVYQVEANAAGQADKINATGTATISGSTVQVLAQMGNYAPTTKYTILTAASGVTGTFSGVTSNLAFLTPSLSYDPNDVFLTLTRNTTSFQNIAITPNQKAVAAALDNSPILSPLVQAVVLQSQTGALQAFDALSGEIYATAQTTMLDDQRYAREAVLGRLRQAAFGGAGSLAALGTGGPVLAYAEPDTALGYAAAGKPAFPVKAPPLALVQSPEITWWAQGVGAWGHIDSDGNAAGAKRNLAAAFTGVDRRLGDNWRVGFMGGYTDSSLSVSARASAANIETAYLGAYAGATYGPWSLRSGAIVGFSTIAANRTIGFPGFLETASSRYDGGAAQVFGEVGYGVALGAIAFEPFAGAAFVHVETEGLTETGRVAALTGAGARDDVGYTTLGARLATNWTLGIGMWLTPRASVAWQHAFGDITPVDTLAFQNTGAGFTVAGLPIARDAALVEGALDLHVTRAATLGISYVGQLATSAQDHSVKGNFTWKF